MRSHQTFHSRRTPIHVTPSPSCDTGPVRTSEPSFLALAARFLAGNKPEFCSVDHPLPRTNRGRSSGFQIDVACSSSVSW